MHPVLAHAALLRLLAQCMWLAGLLLTRWTRRRSNWSPAPLVLTLMDAKPVDESHMGLRRTGATLFWGGIGFFLFFALVGGI